MNVYERIDYILEAADNWLQPDNAYLQQALDRTVDEGLFSFEDIKHALLVLKDRITREALERWAANAGLDDGAEASGTSVLCLHAGNLPLVGFQNALAVLLSGATYVGKISNKDPYLLPTFLNEIKKTAGWSDQDAQWAHRLDDLEGYRFDRILFAGSESSIPGVRKEINRLDLAHDKTKYLIRTAHFSIAYLDREEPSAMEDLVEAAFRYGGKGCRSVAVVVSPFSLDAIKCHLTDYVESFWLQNPQHEKPPPALKYRYAYNKAVERPQAWLDDFLVQEGGLELDRDFVLYWVQGDEQTVAERAGRYGPQLQSIYVAEPGQVTIPEYEYRTEPLAQAQRPPLDWKPDGVDTVAWLTDKG